jgi:hypothetical protein
MKQVSQGREFFTERDGTGKLMSRRKELSGGEAV